MVTRHFLPATFLFSSWALSNFDANRFPTFYSILYLLISISLTQLLVCLHTSLCPDNARFFARPNRQEFSGLFFFAIIFLRAFCFSRFAYTSFLFSIISSTQHLWGKQMDEENKFGSQTQDASLPPASPPHFAGPSPPHHRLSPVTPSQQAIDHKSQQVWSRKT